MSIKKPPESRVTLEDLIAASSRVGAVIESVRGTMLAPDARKRPPTFSTNQVATVCGLEKAQMDYRVKKGDLPTGDMESGHRRKFSLEDTRTWARSTCTPTRRIWSGPKPPTGRPSPWPRSWECARS